MQGRPTGALADLLNDYEYQFLRTLSSPIRALKTMLLVKTLSYHANDEEYLGGEGTEWALVSSSAEIAKSMLGGLNNLNVNILS